MFELYNVAIIPLIVGVIEMFKQVGFPKRFCPLIAVAFGITLGIFYLSEDVKEGIIIGLMYGLSASGLYSSTKNIVERRNEA